MTYNIPKPNINAKISDFNPLDFIWYFHQAVDNLQGQIYLGIVLRLGEFKVTILKYYNGIWKLSEVFPNTLSHRDKDFSTELYLKRRMSLNIDGIKFELPANWKKSFL